MLKPGDVERRAIAVVAFLMIASGVGAFVSVSLKEAARSGYMAYPVGYICGIHAFTIIIPGFLGLFVVLGCGCCNTRPAYITSLVFDCVGLALYIISIIAVGLIFELVPYNTRSPSSCTLVQGQCECPSDGSSDWYDYWNDFENGCDRNNMFYASRAALFSMWAFGLLFTIIHLVLVARLSCTMRSGTPGQVLSAPGQSGVHMQTLVVDGSPQVYAVPTSAYLGQPQTSSIQGTASVGTAPVGTTPVGVPSSAPCTGQPPFHFNGVPAAHMGDTQTPLLTAQPQPSSKSAVPPE